MRRPEINGQHERSVAGWYGKLPAAGDFVHRRMPRELIAWWDHWLQTSLGAAAMAGDNMRRSYAQAPMWNFLVPAYAGQGWVQLGCIAASHDRVGRRYPLLALHARDSAECAASFIDGTAPFFRQLGSALLGATRHGYGPEQLEHAVVRAEASLPQARGALARTDGIFGRTDTGASDGAKGSTGVDLGIDNGRGDILSILNNTATPVQRLDGPAWPDLSACFNPHSHSSYWWTNQVDGAPLQTFIHSGALNVALFSTLFVPVAGVRRLG